MLNKYHHQSYQAFVAALEVVQNNLIDLGVAPKSTVWKQDFQKMQQVFQSQILPLTGEEMEGASFSRWRSVQTEIQRGFKLLETDVMFWQVSRTAETSKQRQGQICTRITQLIGYCQLLLD